MRVIGRGIKLATARSMPVGSGEIIYAFFLNRTYILKLWHFLQKHSFVIAYSHTLYHCPTDIFSASVSIFAKLCQLNGS